MNSYAPILVAITGGLVFFAVRPQTQAPVIPEDMRFWNPSGRVATLIHDVAANGLAYACPSRQIAVLFQENNSQNAEWEKTTFTYSTSYDIVHVDARLGGREVFVTGLQDTGSDWNVILEKWTFPAVKGSYVIQLPDPLQRGEVMGPFQPSLLIQGGVYLPHENRKSKLQPASGGNYWRPQPTKSVLYLGKAYGLIDSLVVDPEGRFLVFHSNDTGNLYSLDLLSGSNDIALEASAATLPSLSEVRNMEFYQSTTQGRFLFLTQQRKSGAAGPTGHRIILTDPDNDGLFDQQLEFTPAQFTQSVWANSADWVDYSNFGWDWQGEF